MLAGGAETLYELQRRDISSFNVRLVPRTRALADQKLLDASIDDWWFHKLQSGFIAGQKEWGVVSTSNLYNDYMTSLSASHGLSRRATETQLGIRMKRLVPSLARRRSSAARSNRVTNYDFPPLAECRALFEKRMNRVRLGGGLEAVTVPPTNLPYLQSSISSIRSDSPPSSQRLKETRRKRSCRLRRRAGSYVGQVRPMVQSTHPTKGGHVTAIASSS